VSAQSNSRTSISCSPVNPAGGTHRHPAGARRIGRRRHAHRLQDEVRRHRRRRRREPERGAGRDLGAHGMSGSGKSTLLRAANGLNPVTRSRCAYAAATPMWIGPPAIRCSCGGCAASALPWFFSSSGSCRGAPVRENVGLGLELRGESARRAQVGRGREARARRPVAMGGPLCERAVGRNAAARRARAAFAPMRTSS